MSAPTDSCPKFRAELTAINLNRLRWFQIVCLPAAALFLISCGIHPELKNAAMILHAGIDLLLISIMLGLTLIALRQPSDSPFRALVVWRAIIVFLAGMQAWYFMSLPEFGQNPNYILSIITAGALVLLPPRSAWLLLAANTWSIAIFSLPCKCPPLFSLQPYPTAPWA